jgi:hypothetical protein
MLEVDENFGTGFVVLSEQTSLTYTDVNLINGHAYTYRVAAQNFLGYGPFSTSFTFIPIQVPGQPLSPPSNVPTLTTKTTIYI